MSTRQAEVETGRDFATERSREEPNMKTWDFTGGPVVRTSPSKARVQVQSLVGELRSHMPQGQKKKKKHKIETIL